MSEVHRTKAPTSGGPGQIAVATSKPQNFWGTLLRLGSYLKKYTIAVVIVVILAIGSQIFQVQTPKVLGKATTEIFKGFMVGIQMKKNGLHITHYPINFDKIKEILFTVILLYLIAALFSFLQQFIMTQVIQSAVYNLRKELKAKMKIVPISYYDTHSNGDILSRAVNDMDNIAGTLQQNLTQLITSITMFLGTLWMMLTISWQLTLIALITIPLSLVVVGLVAPRSQKHFIQQQKSLGLLNNQIEENYAGQLIDKSFNQEDKAIKPFNEENEKLYQSSWKAQMISGLIMPLMNFVSNLGYVFVAIYGGIQVTKGKITLGNVQAFLQYTQQFSQPITQLANITNSIQTAVASAERVFEVLDEPDMKDTKVDVSDQQTDNKIEMDHVVFEYEENVPLLKDYSLSVKPGEMIAIVGPTGAGKTTIINLLERFYDIQGGSIRLDGKDTRNITREELRSHFAMVLQDTWLFNGTVWDNLKYGNENATDDEIIAAAKAAHVDDFVRQLPDEYQTVLDESASNISQGQKQLLTIARAFVANPEILILDEATSSVDTRTEIHIQHAMGRLLQNRTSFVVAHRLSTIRDADKIIVMNHGSIIETGNHHELIEKNGFYADLYNSQFAGNVSL
ncbi:ABC transporter ATP-binding protein [Xylocopilactobacillus apicola]|uniref:Multidrug ABC transporter ATP-binding protein n=1 Tax=Xylocopilactobacillus apicola TaxID=2932184 RepID=A0AAU9D653_9LACO|nr:ABC transporter ATP-binding protein [Xylocopilactobacillus apicola]BDR59304.1 multidrug ABC transporter ATP-binding protein [Xylocopilactobacillus apicola]